MATHTTTTEKGTYSDGNRYNVIKIVPSASSTKQDWWWNCTVSGNGIPSTSHLLDWKYSEKCYGARPGEAALADGIWVRKVSAQLTVSGDRVVIRDGASAGDIVFQLERNLSGLYGDKVVYGACAADATLHSALFLPDGDDIGSVTFDPPRLMKPYLHDSSPSNCTFGGGSSRGKCWVKIEVDDTRRQP